MRLLLADETNRDSDRTDFFVYGALHFDLSLLPDINDRIEEIRETYGYEAGDYLKWTFHDAPEHIDLDTHTEAKKEVVKTARDAGAVFIAVLVHHTIA